MPVIAEFGLSGQDRGILSIAFPGVPQFMSRLPPFIPSPIVVLFSDERNLTVPDGVDVVQISSQAQLLLDTKEGFLYFLAEQGLEATDFQIEFLLECDDDVFWDHCKTASVLGHFLNLPDGEAEANGKLYILFDHLFEDFARVYTEYMALRRWMSPHEIFSGVLTMALKARSPFHSGAGAFYKAMLIKNHEFLPRFERALMEFLDHVDGFKQNPEMSVLSFLLECSEPDSDSERS